MNLNLIRRLSPLMLLPLLAAAPVKTAAPSADVRGDYVEARTASVFAGACHYNGERVTEGKSAVLAWHITGGATNGVDLAGVKVIAAVSSDDNLAEASAARKTEFRVDAKTDAQASAAVDWARQQAGKQLGQVVAVKRGPITFKHDAGQYQVEAAKFAQLKVTPMPDAACCSQPHLVWYQPMMQVNARRVGYTQSAVYTGGTGSTWNRADENSAFYGTFGKAEAECCE